MARHGGFAKDCQGADTSFSLNAGNLQPAHFACASRAIGTAVAVVFGEKVKNPNAGPCTRTISSHIRKVSEVA